MVENRHLLDHYPRRKTLRERIAATWPLFFFIASITLLSLIFLVILKPPQFMGFRVMTFNLRYLNQNDKENNWEFRKSKVIQLIKDQGPDLIGFQEGVLSQIADVQDGVGTDYAWFGRPRDDGISLGEASPIMYKKSRFELITNYTFWLSTTPDIPSKSWNSSLNRVCTYGMFKDIKTGEKFYHFNTHLDHKSVWAQLEGLKLISQQIELQTTLLFPVFLTGDFNANATNPAVEWLNTNGNNTVWRLVNTQLLSRLGHKGPDFTFIDFNFEEHNLIDYIYLYQPKVNQRQIMVDSHETVTDLYTPGHPPQPSDHYPVKIRVDWEIK